MQETSWWADFYDDVVADLLMHRRSPREIEQTGEFLTAQLRISQGDVAFDQCSGTGALSLALARRGIAVVAVEQSENYVAYAKAAAIEAGLAKLCSFHAGDALCFQTARPCDAAFNWGTGFGNALSDEQNRAMLLAAGRSLRPGGRLVLEFQNIAKILCEFQKVMLYRGPTRHGEAVLVRESHLDLAKGVLRQNWLCFTKENRKEVQSAVRLYLPHEVGAIVRSCGFSELQFFGDETGQPLTEKSPRCIVVATKDREAS